MNVQRIPQLLFFFLFIISSCNDPLKKQFNPSTIEKDLNDTYQELPEEDHRLLTNYLLIKMMKEEKMEGKTFGELLEEARFLKSQLTDNKKDTEQQNRLNELIEKSKQREINSLLNLKLIKKQFLEENYHQYIQYEFDIRNNGKRPILAFLVNIIFQDLEGNEINRVDLVFDEGIQSKESRRWKIKSSYNEFLEEDVNLKKKKVEELNVKWHVERLIFMEERKD